MILTVCIKLFQVVEIERWRAMGVNGKRTRVRIATADTAFKINSEDKTAVYKYNARMTPHCRKEV